MAKLTQQDIAAATSTQPEAARVAFFPDVVDMDGELTIDVMDSTVLRAIHDLPAIGAVVWRKGLSLPAISLDAYNTTSWHWILLIYNGFITKKMIPNGATLNLPNVSLLRKNLRLDNNGSVVTI